MTVDLICLVVSALWGQLLVTVEIMAKTRIAGPAWNAGNRETEPEWPAWIRRASRALSNHKENFPLFLTAVVVVHLAHANDRVSAIAAIVYVVARAFHAILYVAGVKGVRTLVFLVATVAVLAIFSRLIF